MLLHHLLMKRKRNIASDILNVLDFNIECEYLFSNLDANSKYIPTKAYMMLTMMFPCKRQLHQYLCKDCVTVATKITSVKCVHCQTDHLMKDVAIRFDLLNQPKL